MVYRAQRSFRACRVYGAYRVQGSTWVQFMVLGLGFQGRGIGIQGIIMGLDWSASWAHLSPAWYMQVTVAFLTPTCAQHCAVTLPSGGGAVDDQYTMDSM